MHKKLCVIPGDGIGLEVTQAAVNVLIQVLPDVQIVEVDAGWQTFQRTGTSVPNETFDKLRECGAGLFGAVSSPSGTVSGYESAILRLRQELELFANIRPINGRWSSSPRDDVDFTIVRENTECLYVGRETMHEDHALAERVISKTASQRIGVVAAQVAMTNGAKRITVVHKANVLPISDGLFRDCVLEAIDAEIGSNKIQVDQSLVDIAALRIVEAPQDFGLIVTTNMFGDILSDLAAYWCGGMGRAPSLNLGDGIAIAEPVHGSAPDIAGQGIADPTAAILSIALLCRLHWSEPEAANLIESAVERALSQFNFEEPVVTKDFVDVVVTQAQRGVSMSM